MTSRGVAEVLYRKMILTAIKEREVINMTLGAGVIYLGVVCFVFSALIYFYQKKSKNKYGDDTELNARIIFFKHKWKQNNLKEVIAFGLMVLALLVVGIFTHMAVLIYLAGIAFLVMYIYLYNKMMIYVEEKAFR